MSSLISRFHSKSNIIPSDHGRNAVPVEKPLDIVVIGGSLAGLMAAIVLRRQGHNVRVLEQNQSRDQDEKGAGITVGPAAREFFAKYDLTKEDYFVDCPGIQFLDAESKRTRLLKSPLFMSTWSTLYYRLLANFNGRESKFCMSPPDLGGLSQGKERIEMGARVVGVSYADGRVTIDYQDTIKNVSESLKSDLVIAADGASSTIRQLLLPDVKRTYSGYVAWRGFVLESEVSSESRKILDPECNAFAYAGGYILCYIVPSNEGSREIGRRRFNWVWYSKCSDSSPQFKEIMTDSDGKIHRNSIPKGKMRNDIWKKQRAYGNEVLNEVFRELINKTTEPFLSVVQDYAAPKAAFFGGKVLLIGDALATFRPHMALSLNQAGLDALLLEKLMAGDMTLKEWEKEVVKYGHRTQKMNVAFGNYYLYGGMVFVKSVVAYLMSLLPFSSFLRSEL